MRSSKRWHLTGCPTLVAFRREHVSNGPVGSVEESELPRIGFVVAEAFFCLLFTAEMLIRIDQQSWYYFQDLLNLLDYTLVLASWLDVATSVATYRERVQLASTIRVFRFVRIIRLAHNSHSQLLVIARGLANAVENVLQLSIITAVFVFMMAVVLTTLVAEDEYAIARWPQAKMRPVFKEHQKDISRRR